MRNRSPIQSISFTFPIVLGLALAIAHPQTARADWTNNGGNAGRNGMTAVNGPAAATVLWSGGPASTSAIIAYQPVIEGNRVFMVRQNSFIPNNVPNDSPIIARNLATGAVEWPANLPYNPGDWTAWIAGVRNGRVFASRSGNGASVWAKLYCLDAASGAVCWLSQDTISAGPYDGVVFAPNGDPIVASFTFVRRIRANDGTTAWNTARVASVSGTCGAAVYGDAVYVADAVAGGNVIKRYDINTGNYMYQSPVMSGFTIQNSPMTGPDGTIYLSRTQNNVSVDFFYAFTDTGAAINVKWFVPANWSTSSEFAVGPDGSVYMMGPGYHIYRLNPLNGAVMNQSNVIPTDYANGNISPRLAADPQGRVFFSNGQFTVGRFYSFNADLTERWSVAVANINIGAPAIGGVGGAGSDGTLVVCGVGTNVTAYKTAPPPCPADITGDGQVNVNDLLAVIGLWGPCMPPCPPYCGPDITHDCWVNVNDLLAVINAWGPCP